MEPYLECPCTAPLRRWTSKESKNGNYGDDFMKCESKQEGKIIEKCNHFEWIDEYVTRLQREGFLDLKGAQPGSSFYRQPLRIWVSHSVAPTVVDVDLKGELKKTNKNFKQMIELKKQDNLISLGFCFSIVALGLAYLLVISR
ncbi:hypothetical protein D1007_01261 [Hordeum vulgare]|nr:hypothetical protein D1007_01261 [Hordeum vulgare]